MYIFSNAFVYVLGNIFIDDLILIHIQTTSLPCINVELVTSAEFATTVKCLCLLNKNACT